MMTRPIRVVVANQPRLMRELVLEAITEQPDIELVAEIQNEDEIAEMIDGAEPDYLIIALHESDHRPEICDVLLRRHPRMKILAIAPELNTSIFVWATFDIHSNSVESSEAGILAALRSGNQPVEG
jgi:DNA-binding NarL/FixJ family response regulator